MDDTDADILALVRLMTPVERQLYHQVGGRLPRLLPPVDPGWHVPDLEAMRRSAGAKAAKWRWKYLRRKERALLSAKAGAKGMAGDVPRPVLKRRHASGSLVEPRSVRVDEPTDTRMPGHSGARALRNPGAPGRRRPVNRTRKERSHDVGV